MEIGSPDFRCLDCGVPDLVCAECCVNRHRLHPLHEIQVCSEISLKVEADELSALERDAFHEIIAEGLGLDFSA